MGTRVNNYIKANRNGSRKAELEKTNTGWNAKTKKHKTLDDYSRKGKNAFKNNTVLEDDDR